MSSLERTFIAVKPDGVQRGFVGKIIGRFEDKGFKLVALKMLTADNNLLATHYEEHVEKPFFDGLLKYMASGPVVAMVWEGKSVVKMGRLMLGETDPADSKPGTIRADFCIGIRKSILHGSDSMKSAQKEIALWFKPDELNECTSGYSDLLYE